MTWEPNDFEELAGELRRRVGADFRQEAQEVERLTDLMRRRRADLGEVAREAMRSGAHIAITSRSGSWAGEITAVGTDYLTLMTPTLHVEARLLDIAIEVRAARSGGRSATPAAATWKARLAELAEAGETITLLAPDLGLEMNGAIELVASDHLQLIGAEAPTYVPLVSVAIILRSRPD